MTGFGFRECLGGFAACVYFAKPESRMALFDFSVERG